MNQSETRDALMVNRDSCIIRDLCNRPGLSQRQLLSQDRLFIFTTVIFLDIKLFVYEDEKR